jgi:GT2 family glycosyltransferase
MRIAVCVATYQRPDDLRRLLVALGRQEFAGEAPEVEIVVIDNDATASARSQFETTSPDLPWPAKYAVEKSPGISFARNKAVATVSVDAEWIVFVDDDEVPEPTWLDALIRVQGEYDADVVAGPVLPEFPDSIQPWLKEGGFFDRRRHATGTVLPHAFTNNVLVRRKLFYPDGLSFDEQFALTGGSDRHFFRRASRAGYRIVWADEAVVRERVPANRATPSWLRRRAYRTGTTTALVDLDLTPTVAMRAVLAAKGLTWLLIGGAQYIAGLVRGRGARLHAARSGAYGVGLLAGLAGRRYEEYRRPQAG